MFIVNDFFAVNCKAGILPRLLLRIKKAPSKRGYVRFYYNDLMVT